MFRLSDQPTLEGSCIKWRVKIAGRWHQGVADTVTDAEQEIDRRRRGELRRIGEIIGENLRARDLLKKGKA